MRPRSAKRNKLEILEASHLTRPPRMEGKAKEAMMQPVRKKKKGSPKKKRMR